MKIWIICHLVLSAIFAVIIGIEFDSQALLFFLCGTALSLANIGLLYFSWKRILAKKSIALAVSVIVLKYGITGYLIYKVAKLGLYPLGWTAGGLGLFLLSALCFGTVSSRFQAKTADQADEDKSVS